MKPPLIFFCFLCLSTLSLHAQRWDLVQPDRELIFAYQDSLLNYQLLMDSTQVLGGDTVHYPYRILEEIDYSYVCFDPQRISWAGEYMLEQPGGKYVFFNQLGDS